jgi:alkaline phosphatase
VFAGGRVKFLPSNVSDPANSAKKGDRVDNRNLIDEWKAKMTKANKKHSFVWNINDFNKLKPNEHDHVLGLLSHDHMDYDLDRVKNSPVEQPSIVEMTNKAIELLGQNTKGFFLLVEGGKIDQGKQVYHFDFIRNKTFPYIQNV